MLTTQLKIVTFHMFKQAAYVPLIKNKKNIVNNYIILSLFSAYEPENLRPKLHYYVTDNM